MLIEGREYRINVLILLRPQETGVTIETVETLLESLEDGVTISVLLNGGRSDRLRGLFGTVPSIKYYESEANLGVAGGRNYLLKTEECRDCDIVMILDNDVIVPQDYVRRLASFLLKQRNAGVVGAAAANARAGIGLNAARGYGHTGAFGNKIFKVDSEHIRKDALADLQPYRLFHIGGHPDYFYTYFSLRPQFYALLGRFLGFLGPLIQRHPHLVHHSAYLERIRQGSAGYRVSNVAGCSQAFRRSLVDSIGPLDDRFNPYGFEDAEFGIRAIQAGYANYIDPHTWLLHGTDERHSERDAIVMAETLFRGHTVLASAVLPGIWRWTLRKLVWGGFLLELAALRRGTFARLGARLRGLRQGLALVAARPAAPAVSRRAPRRGLLERAAAKVRSKAHAARFKAAGLGRPLTCNERRLLALRDRCAGRRGFILGNGPSLRETDLAALKDEVTIGCNGLFLLRDAMGFLPTFYTVEDTLVAEDRAAALSALKGTTKVFPLDLQHWLRPDEDTVYVNFIRLYEGFPKFSGDFVSRVYWGGTVTMLNLQLAWHLGIREVYLVGLDHHYKVPPADERDGVVITSRSSDANHCHPDYFGPGFRYHDPRSDRMEVAYQEAKRFFDANGGRIYNATAGGRLEVFPRVRFDSLFLKADP